MRSREQRTAKAVLDALPSSMDPFKLSKEEALNIGRQLHPEGRMLELHPDFETRTMSSIVLEQLGRGFLYAAIYSMPYWLYKCFEVKFQDIDEEDRLNFCWILMEQQTSPIRQARNWVYLCSGYSADEVIDIELGREAKMIQEEVSSPLEQRVEALADE